MTLQNWTEAEPDFIILCYLRLYLPKGTSDRSENSCEWLSDHLEHSGHCCLSEFCRFMLCPKKDYKSIVRRVVNHTRGTGLNRSSGCAGSVSWMQLCSTWCNRKSSHILPARAIFPKMAGPRLWPKSDTTLHETHTHCRQN